MASDADDGDGDAARRTAGVSDRQARAGVASAGKRQHQVPLIGIGQCHAMTASNQINFVQGGAHGRQVASRHLDGSSSSSRTDHYPDY